MNNVKMYQAHKDQACRSVWYVQQVKVSESLHMLFDRRVLDSVSAVFLWFAAHSIGADK